jgi:hypothetical protein
MGVLLARYCKICGLLAVLPALVLDCSWGMCLSLVFAQLRRRAAHRLAGGGGMAHLCQLCRAAKYLGALAWPI